MIEFIWNLRQSGQIADVKRATSRADTEIKGQEERIAELEFHVNRMALACQALWELLRDRSNIPESELLAKISEIDLRDGVKDQRLTPTPIKCGKCGRTSNSNYTRCIYCGADMVKSEVFR